MAIEPSEYDIHYKPRTSIKEQVVADFLLELTLANAEAETKAEADQVKERDEVCSLHTIGLELQWTLSIMGHPT